MAGLDEELRKRVVFELPGMQDVPVRRDEVYKTVDDVALTFDVYYPPDFAEEEPRPCVVFVHGEGPAEILKNAKARKFDD